MYNGVEMKAAFTISLFLFALGNIYIKRFYILWSECVHIRKCYVYICILTYICIIILRSYPKTWCTQSKCSLLPLQVPPLITLADIEYNCVWTSDTWKFSCYTNFVTQKTFLEIVKLFYLLSNDKTGKEENNLTIYWIKLIQRRKFFIKVQ